MSDMSLTQIEDLTGWKQVGGMKLHPERRIIEWTRPPTADDYSRAKEAWLADADLATQRFPFTVLAVKDRPSLTKQVEPNDTLLVRVDWAVVFSPDSAHIEP